jgi:hypothetical protein
MASTSTARGLLVRDDDDPLGISAGGERQRDVVGGSSPIEEDHAAAERREPVARGLKRLGELEWKRIAGRLPHHTAAGQRAVRSLRTARFQS